MYLDNEVETAPVVVVADGGVAAGDDFPVYLCGEGDVLADREAEDVLGMGQLETVARNVGGSGGDTQRGWRQHTWRCWVKPGSFSRGGTP